MIADITDIRLVRLFPDQVEVTFDALVRESCAALIRPDDDSGWFRLYQRLMDSTMFCYMVVGKADERDVVLGILYLELNVDSVSGAKTLNIWNLFGYKLATMEHYKAAFGYILEIAANLKVRLVTAVSSQSTVLRVVEELGGNTSQRLITFEV